MMKKLLAVLLLLAMSVSLFACTQEGQGEDTTAQEVTSEAGTTQDQTTEEATTEETTEETTEGTTEETTEPEPEPEPAVVELYQLAPDRDSLMQSYVIKTENGKLIVIDGGIDGAGKDREPYMPAALRSILGLGQDDYFEVEAWFLSHAHKDHMYELSKMLSEYSAESNYKINNI
jgi:predicted small secreted protein